jgi:hypothetical protein
MLHYGQCENSGDSRPPRRLTPQQSSLFGFAQPIDELTTSIPRAKRGNLRCFGSGSRFSPIAAAR